MMPRIVIETDIFDDVDDVGALAVAHALADAGKLEIAAVCVNTPSRWGHRAVRIVNRFFGRPEIPVGVRLPLDDSLAANDFARRLVQTFGAPCGDEDVVAATTVWRTLLASADDGSLTLVSLGFYGNLTALLEAVGPAAIAAKVRRGVVMGGRFPSGTEFNFRAAPGTTRRFLHGWPTPLDLLGWEAGAEVETGRGLVRSDRSDPVSVAYRAFCGPGAGRPSWDPMTVALALDEPEWGFGLSGPGTVVVASDGSDVWRSHPGGTMRYVVDVDPAETAARIDALLETAIDARHPDRRAL